MSSGYYVLALTEGKVRRHEAQSLPDAQKLMRKHGPNAAIFTGQKCFGTLPGISSAARDALILAARGGGLGDCAFCDDDAVSMVDGDPVCAKHRMGDEAEEHDDEADDGDDEAEERETSAPLHPAPAVTAPAPAQPAAVSRCAWEGCTKAPSVHPVSDASLAGYCGAHRGIAKVHGIRPGQTAPLCTRCKKNPRGAQSYRTIPERRDLCARCRKADIDRIAMEAKARAKTAAPEKAPPAGATAGPTTPRGGHVTEAPHAATSSTARSVFEQLLRDHELVEIIGREVVTALAARVKGGAA